VQKEYYTERLKFLIEVFKLVWLSILGVGGGSVGLLLGPYDLVRYGWAEAGIILVLVFMKRIWAHLESKE
jgi:hypothetical protein